eukprot:TRINITY_DN45220_c0_g1_i3.p1 TRINITY_DN45220_c0_g1~~TRINITY_DN45220_c0_g1_i3.p1  ORF type:complete len:127 (-),score=17.42 TRINITY_DN45220_c0_g1_i3:107-487(-)
MWFACQTTDFQRHIYGTPHQGNHFLQRRPEKRFNDTLSVSLKTLDLSRGNRQPRTEVKCGSAVCKGAKTCEANKTATAELRRQTRTNSEPPTAASIPYPHCQRIFQARIGLTSHITRRTRPRPKDG